MLEMIPPFLGLAEEKGFEPWVTVVNDVRYASDSAITKNGSLVHELIMDPTLRAKHARDLVSRVSGDGFKGLHLDYERVPESDTIQFRAFVEQLRVELRRLGLGLEVVIEPMSGPLPVPGSTSVTVMAYDLFGTHSGPGPRSTPTFVSELSHKASVDGDSSAALALAVRGFAWEPDGDIRSLDWSVAQRLAAETSNTQRRNADHVLSAQLNNGTVIWFEDVESILSKWQAAWKAGFRRLAIWRLGGNDESFFDLIRRMRQGQTGSNARED
jgi:spore germination protein YaaH